MKYYKKGISDVYKVLPTVIENTSFLDLNSNCLGNDGRDLEIFNNHSYNIFDKINPSFKGVDFLNSNRYFLVDACSEKLGVDINHLYTTSTVCEREMIGSKTATGLGEALTSLSGHTINSYTLEDLQKDSSTILKFETNLGVFEESIYYKDLTTASEVKICESCGNKYIAELTNNKGDTVYVCPRCSDCDQTILIAGLLLPWLTISTEDRCLGCCSKDIGSIFSKNLFYKDFIINNKLIINT